MKLYDRKDMKIELKCGDTHLWKLENRGIVPPPDVLRGRKKFWTRESVDQAIQNEIDRTKQQREAAA